MIAEFLAFLLLLFLTVFPIFLCEIARDYYHYLGHKSFPLLKKYHRSHHLITKGKNVDFSRLDTKQYRCSQWRNDLPENIVMILISFIPPVLLFVLPNKEIFTKSIF